METLEDAQQLSRLMVSIGKLSGRKVVALLSDMNQPLGSAVGNALETREAIDTLHGKGPADFREHCLRVASYMLLLGGKADNLEDARLMAINALDHGSAWQKFRALVSAQGGDVAFIDEPERLPKASIIKSMNSIEGGWVESVNAREIGETAVDLGAGRARKGDPIDQAVGIFVHQKVGNLIRPGDFLFTIHANSEEKFDQARMRLINSIHLSDHTCEPLPLTYGIVS
jgi:pyrimidine-nucleoside phosphorylase